MFKDNIKKNEDKKIKLENELERLKKDAESIDAAVEDTRKEESKIRKEMENLKVKVEEENQNRKDLENSTNWVKQIRNSDWTS